MGRVKEQLYYAESDAELASWEASNEGRAEKERMAREREEVKARQERRENVWKIRNRSEWEEWVRIRPLLNVFIGFWADHLFDFDDYLKEVGRRPSAHHIVTRVDERKPYQQGNLAWVRKMPEPPSSPNLNARQAAAYLGVSLQTLYNNRKHIPSLPGFRTLMFNPKVLDELRASARFMSKRLSKQGKFSRNTT